MEVVPGRSLERDTLIGALGRYAASTPEHNTTLAAIAEAFAAAPEPVVRRVPFSSRRRWSALELAGETLALGAPERFDVGPLRAAAERHAS